MRILLFLFSLCFAQLLFAAGPEKVATVNRQLWPDAIENPVSFNQASTQEIQMFVRVMSHTKLETKADIQALTHLQHVNPQTVHTWLRHTQRILLNNYQAAGHPQVTTWAELVRISQQPIAPRLKPWASAAKKFHTRYLYEQVRLAALFPRITSEILPLSAEEVTGAQFHDGEFLLTYDDGPAPVRGKQLVTALNKEGIHAFFFLIGQKLETLHPPKSTYANQCIGSHGYQHKSHQFLKTWARSLEKNRRLLRAYHAGPFWFRPPYGQRSQALLANMKAHGERVMLWNIDSQDWNRKLTDQQVADRVVTLMLLWRHGVILYHSIHPRALANLPELNRLITASGHPWLDCRQF